MNQTLAIVADPTESRQSDGCGERAELERSVLRGYVDGSYATYRVQVLLGFANRFETQVWLGEMGAHEAYSLGDLDADRRTLDRLLPG